MWTFAKYLLLLLLACPLQANGNGEVKRGLYFQSHEVDKDKRTLLDLTPDKPLTFKDAFSMDFDLKLRHTSQNFGLVFRIIADETLNVDLMINLNSPQAHFSLIVDKQTVIQYMSSELGYAAIDDWIKVLFTLDPHNGNISLSMNGVKKDAVYPFAGVSKFDIGFGVNVHNMFSTTDIAPMTIKDIRLLDARSRMVRYWTLDVHSDNAVYDECKHAKATVMNPQWEIDSHTNWSKPESFVLPGSFYGIAFDNVHDRVIMVKDKSIFTYNTNTQRIDTVRVLRGIPYNTEFSQLEYDPVKDRLISYNLLSNKLATFDFGTSEWSNEDRAVVLPYHTHHSSYYLAEDSLLVSFAGYGYHRYHSVLHNYRLATGTWERMDLSGTIAPRYLGSMGYLPGKKILYFGGFGNESGRQEEPTRNYYDLFSIDVENGTVEKVWELPNPEEHFTNSNSMVIDEKSRKFYALAYANQRYASVVKLHEYSLDRPEYRVVGDTIPYPFNDVNSYCDLFLNSNGTKLFSVISYVKAGNTDIQISSIAYPPLNRQEVMQEPPTSYRMTWVVFVCLAVGAGVIAAFMIFRKKSPGLISAGKGGLGQIPDKGEIFVYDNNYHVEKRSSSISLLGDFMVVDTDGNDITKNFTPTTKLLFLLLLLSTIKNGKGISSQELSRILWHDKNDDSARNNRNVYINKLRSILKSFSGISIVKREGYWIMESEKSVFCDYSKALKLIKLLQVGEHLDLDLLTELVDIGLNGALLPYIQQSEWLEPYQSDFGTQMIECLIKCSKYEKVASDMQLSLKIADVIQLHDNIDEDAIRIKCRALFRLGHKNQALQAFNKFTVDYEYLLAAKHDLQFDELVM